MHLFPKEVRARYHLHIVNLQNINIAFRVFSADSRIEKIGTYTQSGGDVFRQTVPVFGIVAFSSLIKGLDTLKRLCISPRLAETVETGR